MKRKFLCRSVLSEFQTISALAAAQHNGLRGMPPIKRPTCDGEEAADQQSSGSCFLFARRFPATTADVPPTAEPAFLAACFLRPAILTLVIAALALITQPAMKSAPGYLYVPQVWKSISPRIELVLFDR